MSATRLRRNRDFMLLWNGQTASALGSQISTVAYPLLVLAVTGSPAKAGIAGFAKTFPIVALALPAGELADRLNRRHLMVACDGARMLAMAAVPIALAAGHIPYWLIVVVAFVDGSGFVVSYVTERGVLRRLVAPEQLGEAVVRNEARFFGSMLAGPPIGGALFGIGRAVPFLADAVSYAVSSATLLAIRPDFQARPAEATSRDIREGMRWVWKRPFFRVAALLFAGSNPVFTGLYLLVVLIARDHGASSALIGVMLGIAAAGGLLGALLAPSLRRRLSARHALVGESWMLVVALPWLLLAHDAVLLGVIVAAAELITPVTNSFVVGYRVALAPDELQGRVQAAATLFSFSAGWVGPLAVGFLAQHAGITATVLTLTGWVFALAIVATTTPAFRRPPA